MKIPKEVKIGGIKYIIEISEHKDDDLTEIKNWGITSYANCKIRLNNDVNSQKIWQTLFHEILHIINIEYKTGLKEDNIERISNGFYAFLKDNKLLKD